MFLRRLRIENVRSIRQLELNFEAEQPESDEWTGDDTPQGDCGLRKWTLLLGENGCGKSTVLRSIALVLAGSSALGELLAEPDAWIRAGSKRCSIELDYATKDNELRKVSLTFSRGQHLKRIFDANRATMEQLDGALEHSLRSYFIAGYGASRRLSVGQTSPTRIGTFRNRRAQAVGTLFSADAPLNPLESWAVELHYRQGAAGLRTVAAVMKDLLPGLKFKKIDRERGELIFGTPDGDVPLARLSDGYQNMAGWCGDLLYRITSAFEDYQKPLETRGLLLVDEIDLHLHPVWQRTLREFLDRKLPNFQIVATTHSALTAQQSGAGELYFLRRAKASAPPRLEGFRGTPRNLLLHQLLLSPQFGVETVDSHSVEELKVEYRKLKGSKRRSATGKRRLQEISAQLATLPDWFDQPSAGRVLAPPPPPQPTVLPLRRGADSETPKPTAAKRSRRRSTPVKRAAKKMKK